MIGRNILQYILDCKLRHFDHILTIFFPIQHVCGSTITVTKVTPIIPQCIIFITEHFLLILVTFFLIVFQFDLFVGRLIWGLTFMIVYTVYFLTHCARLRIASLCYCFCVWSTAVPSSICWCWISTISCLCLISSSAR